MNELKDMNPYNTLEVIESEISSWRTWFFAHNQLRPLFGKQRKKDHDDASEYGHEQLKKLRHKKKILISQILNTIEEQN